MDRAISSWNKLPVFLRWFLCFPLIIIIPSVVRLICPFLIPFADGNGWTQFHSNGAPVSLAALIEQIIANMMFFAFVYAIIYITVPKGKLVVAYVVSSVCVILALFGFFGSVGSFIETTIGKFDLALSLAFWASFAFSGVTGVLYLRSEIKRG